MYSHGMRKRLYIRNFMAIVAVAAMATAVGCAKEEAATDTKDKAEQPAAAKMDKTAPSNADTKTPTPATADKKGAAKVLALKFHHDS